MRHLRAARHAHRARGSVLVLVLAGLLSALSACAASAYAGGEGVSLASSEALSNPLTRWGPGLTSPSGSAIGADARRRIRKSARGISLTRSATRPHWACPESACGAIIDPPAVAVKARTLRSGAVARFTLPAGGPLLEGNGEEGGYDPQDLQSAYKIPTAGGADQTVALVDAYGLPEAEAELAVYRERYGLPACTKATGCFRKVNQQGKESNYPPANAGWETESALDIEMASAACPECHILLVEASSADGPDLAAAVDTAARLGATEISNSWGSPEQECGTGLCGEEAADFDHPSVLITAAAGDDAYDNVGLGAHSPEYPASLPDVVAVGGTSLHKAHNARGWSEEAWVDGGSGCSRFAKPEWQTDPACAGRMTADVAADAACETPVSVYNVHEWELICGTSVSTPLVAGIEAHASEQALSLPGAEAFYEDPSAMFDVGQGSNGRCTPPHEDAYFCHAEVGYDGPTGNGTPDGPLNVAGTAPPIAATRPPSAVSSTGATLNGVVAPNGLETSYHFEYGPTNSYGTSVPVPDASIGTGAQQVSQTLTGLSPEGVYHLRLVASSSAGTAYGEDVAFTTGVPSVTGVAPEAGPDGGGTTVTITGTNFVGASTVKFGPSEAESFTVESETSISVVAPAGSGPVDVTVSSPAGTSATSAADSFSYEKLGSVLTWGEDDLGNGTTKGDSAVPVEVTALPEAVSLSTGDGHSVAVLKDGRVMAWGENLLATVGNGTYNEQPVPVGVCAVGVRQCPDGPYLEEANAVAAGGLQTLALLRNGTVVAWGIGAQDDVNSLVPEPVCVTAETPCEPEHYLNEVTAVAATWGFDLALLRNGTVMAWGTNAKGQLGDGSTTGPEVCVEKFEGKVEESPCSRVPVAVPSLSHVSAIATGFGYGLALLEDGRVMAWGENETGELGDGGTSASGIPTAVCAVGDTKQPCTRDLEEVTAVDAGSFDGYALLKNGTVAAWGDNVRGGLGDGTPSGPKMCKLELEPGSTEKVPCGPVPVKVKNLKEVRAIASGGPLVQLQSGEFVTWGEGVGGVLGNGAGTNSEAPVGVCLAYAQGPCPTGPYLSAQPTVMAAGNNDLVSFPSAPGPVVNSVQPDAGPGSGGTSVTIIGADFTGASVVDFGAAPASEFQVQSPDEITAVSPPGQGTVDVTVSGPEEVSPTSPADHFTYPGEPAVVTGEATAVGAGAATLDATVNPEDELLSDCHFEYGTTPSYGFSVPCASLPAPATHPVAVSAPATNLEAGATYYFRTVATNASGTGYGGQQSFTTPMYPQLGRCVKLTAKTGAYKSSACTKQSAGGEGGRYEWQPWPFADNRFEGSGGATLFETVTYKNHKGREVSSKVKCAASIFSGEYTSAQSISISLTFTGCAGCRSPGAQAEEIKGGPLEAQLGIIAEGPRPTVGWMLNPYSPSPLLRFECGAPPVSSLDGSVIGAVSSVDKMSTGFTLKFKGKSGAQTPERFADGLGDTLSLNEHQAALTMDASIVDDEAVEIKALG